MVSVYDFLRPTFLELKPLLEGTLVYLDAGAAEVLATGLGLPTLLTEVGVAGVCDLASAGPEDAFQALLPARPAAAAGAAAADAGTAAPVSLGIFVTTLLNDALPAVLRAVLAHGGPHGVTGRVSVFSALSQHAHAVSCASQLGVEAYSEWREALGEAAWRAGLRRAPLTVDVRHLPCLSMVPLDDCCWVLPAASAAACMSTAGGLAAGFGGVDAASSGRGGEAAEEEGVEDGDSGRQGLALLAHTLLGTVTAGMGFSLGPVYTCGPVSAALGREVAALPASEGNSNSGSLGLVLVDRSLDLPSALGHSDHVLDAMLALLPQAPRAAARLAAPAAPPPQLQAPGRRPVAAGEVPEGAHRQQWRRAAGLPCVAWRSANVRVDVPGLMLAGPTPSTPPLCGAPAAAWPPLPTAELWEPWDRQRRSALEALAARRGKDGALLLRKWLKDALRVARIPANFRSKASALSSGELQALAAALAQGAAPGPNAGAGEEQQQQQATQPAAPGSSAAEQGSSSAAAAMSVLRHRGLLVLAAAASAALDSAAGQGWEAAAALERQLWGLLQHEGPQAAWATVLDALGGALAGRGPLRVAEVLGAAALLHCWQPHTPGGGQDAAAAAEAQMAELLGAAVRDVAAAAAAGTGAGWVPGLAPVLPDVAERLSQVKQQRRGDVADAEDAQYEAAAARLEVEDAVHELFGALRCAAAAGAKAQLVAAASEEWGTQPDSGARSTASGLGGDGLVARLSSTLLACAHGSVHGAESGSALSVLQPVTSQLQGLLHMGLGRLGLGSMVGAATGGSSLGEKLAGCDVVLLFVVGGISMAEARALGQEVATATSQAAALAGLMGDAGAGPGGMAIKPRLLLAGTALLSPEVTLRQLMSKARAEVQPPEAAAADAVAPAAASFAAAGNSHSSHPAT